MASTDQGLSNVMSVVDAANTSAKNIQDTQDKVAKREREQYDFNQKKNEDANKKQASNVLASYLGELYKGEPAPQTVTAPVAQQQTPTMPQAGLQPAGLVKQSTEQPAPTATPQIAPSPQIQAATPVSTPPSQQVSQAPAVTTGRTQQPVAPSGLGTQQQAEPQQSKYQALGASIQRLQERGNITQTQGWDGLTPEAKLMAYEASVKVQSDYLRNQNDVKQYRAEQLSSYYKEGARITSLAAASLGMGDTKSAASLIKQAYDYLPDSRVVSIAENGDVTWNDPVTNEKGSYNLNVNKTADVQKAVKHLANLYSNPEGYGKAAIAESEARLRWNQEQMAKPTVLMNSSGQKIYAVQQMNEDQQIQTNYFNTPFPGYSTKPVQPPADLQNYQTMGTIKDELGIKEKQADIAKTYALIDKIRSSGGVDVDGNPANKKKEEQTKIPATTLTDLWKSAQEQAKQEASDKAGYFRTDKTDFPEGRAQWKQNRAIEIYRANVAGLQGNTQNTQTGTVKGSNNVNSQTDNSQNAKLSADGKSVVIGAGSYPINNGIVRINGKNYKVQ